MMFNFIYYKYNEKYNKIKYQDNKKYNKINLGELNDK